MTNKTKALMEIKKETADIVLSKVQAFHNRKELDFPPDYSPANALKSAWLIIQETKDMSKRPALDVCTKASIANALLDMVIQGLNPSKKQAYFIVRGNKLCLTRSYFGSKSVALRVDKRLEDIHAEVIYDGDELVYSIKKGKKVVEDHKQKFSNIKLENIVGAYASAIDTNGDVVRSEIMTLEQIVKCWEKSQIKNLIGEDGKIKPGSVHDDFPDEMCKRTATNRLTKHIINSSSDSDLVIESVRRTDEIAVEAEADMEISDEANKGEVIDIGGSETGPEPEQDLDQETEPVEDIENESSDDISPEEAEKIQQKEMAEGPQF